MLASYYRWIPPAELSFNLVNEPPAITGAQYNQTMAPVVEAIMEKDPNRLIIADSTRFGKQPVPELTPLHLVQSTHNYQPHPIAFYGAKWVPAAASWTTTPTWPMWITTSCPTAETYGKRLSSRGKRLASNKTQACTWVNLGHIKKKNHQVVLTWMNDCLANWRQAGLGWALCNLRGAFGLLDSDRADVLRRLPEIYIRPGDVGIAREE